MTPVKDRMRKLRERRQAEGLVRVEVVLTRELIDQCQQPGETINACIQRILTQSVSGNMDDYFPLPEPLIVSGDRVDQVGIVSGDNLPANEASLPVSGNKAIVSQDIPVSGSRIAIVDWVIIAKDTLHLSYQKIADALNARGIPTFSGKGSWHKGNVERFYKSKTG